MLLSIQCFANNIQEFDGKYYVSPASIFVAPDAIYINVDTQLVPVKGIAIDENGIYVTEIFRRNSVFLSHAAMEEE